MSRVYDLDSPAIPSPKENYFYEEDSCLLASSLASYLFCLSLIHLGDESAAPAATGEAI
jgi:hypothetical protein